MYAKITLEIVTLDTPNNVAVIVTDAPAKHGQMICPPFKIRQVSYFPIHSQRLSFNTITNELIQALQSVNKQKNIQCNHVKSFQCSQHKLYSLIS
jgi:hypothetical protein